jgi:plasmid stabilization system protein ParE
MFRKIGKDTEAEHGKVQAQKYLTQLRQAFQDIVERPNSIPARNDLKGKTNLSLHHVGRHYTVFRQIGSNHIVIAGLLNDGRDIPARLKELQSKTHHEIDDIKWQISQRTRQEYQPVSHNNANQSNDQNHKNDHS